MLDEDDAPPGPLDDDAPPPMPPDDEDAPLPELLEPPMPDVLLSGVLLDELEEPGDAGAVDDEEDEPPGTITVSFSFVTVDVEGDGLPPGTTVVVSFFSQPESAKAPTKTNR